MLPDCYTLQMTGRPTDSPVSPRGVGGRVVTRQLRAGLSIDTRAFATLFKAALPELHAHFQRIEAPPDRRARSPDE